MSDRIEIVLVRHASTSWTGTRYCGRSDPPLSATGRIEAAALAHRLGPSLRPGTTLVSGRSRRAVATAEAISRVAGVERIQLDPRWDETDFGEIEGLRFDEVAARRPLLAEAILAGTADIDWPGGEAAVELANRVAQAWNDLIASARPAVVVTHAGPILHALRLADSLAPGGRHRSRDTDLRGIPIPASEVRVVVPVRSAGRRGVLPSPA